jgi:hypothetical protein
MDKPKKALLKIGGFGFLIQWDHPQMANPANDCYKGFLFEEKIGQNIRTLDDLILVRVHGARHAGAGCRKKGAKPILSVPRHWQIYRDKKGYFMEIFHPVQKRLLSFAEVSADFKKVDYYILGSDNEGQRIFGLKGGDFWLLTRLIQPLLRSLLVNVLARRGAFCLHGAGIKMDSCGLIFSGPSGAGKTTIAKLFHRRRGVTILSDETLVLTQKRGEFYVYGTPWPGGGRLAAAEGAPLKKIFFIGHGRKNVIRPLSASRAFKKILAQTVVRAWDKDLVAAILASARKLLHAVDSSDLKFVADPGIARFIKDQTS